MSTWWRVFASRLSPELRSYGASKDGARWNAPNQHVVYLAQSPVNAVVESWVHLFAKDQIISPSISVLRVDVPEYLSTKVAPQRLKPPRRLTARYYHKCQEYGTKWHASRRFAALRVQSVRVCPGENLIINLEHVEAARLVSSQVFGAFEFPTALENYIDLSKPIPSRVLRDAKTQLSQHAFLRPFI